MKTSWIKGANEERVKELEREFRESKLFRSRLSEILQEKLRSKHTESRAKDGYNSPNWAYFQADAIGYERALGEIISILED
jgi:hypothetical protein